MSHENGQILGSGERSIRLASGGLTIFGNHEPFASSSTGSYDMRGTARSSGVWVGRLRRLLKIDDDLGDNYDRPSKPKRLSRRSTRSIAR